MQKLLAFNLLINLVRYFLFAGTAYFVFYVVKRSKWFNRKIQARYPDRAQLINEIRNSLVSVLIFAYVGISISLLNRHGFAKVYFEIERYGWPYFVFSIFALIFWHDMYFYWSHRLLHHPRLFRFHKTHHLSHNTNPFTSFSFHPVEALVQTGFLLVVFLVPVHFLVIVVVTLWQMLFNVIGHLGFEIVPPRFHRSVLGRRFNTVTHHNMHHRYTNQNFGLYFSLWDRLMRTNHQQYEAHYKANAEKMFNN